MATYTPKEYVKKLNKFALSIQDIKPFYEATNEVIIMQEDRIFNKGTDYNGSAIGTYSTKPMLATKKQFPQTSKFKPTVISSAISLNSNIVTKKKSVRRGKTSKANWLWIKFPKASKAVPIMLLQGGYAEFKVLNNRAPAGNKVNLELFGRFRRGFANSANPAKLSKTGFEVVYSVKHTGANPAKKVEGIIERYPNAFKLSKKEREYILEKFREIFIDAILNKK
jgi:hypothetical protein